MGGPCQDSFKSPALFLANFPGKDFLGTKFSVRGENNENPSPSGEKGYFRQRHFALVIARNATHPVESVQGPVFFRRSRGKLLLVNAPTIPETDPR